MARDLRDLQPERSLKPQLPVMTGQPNPQADGLEVPVGIGPAPFQPSQPRMGDQSRRIILPGADFPPAGAIPVDVIGDADLVGLGTGTLITVIIPDTYTFRIAGIGFGADDETALRFLVWSIIASPPGVAVSGYVNQPAAVGSIPILSSVFVLRGSSEVITVVATNSSALTLHFVARLQGWFYSEKEAA